MKIRLIHPESPARSFNGGQSDTQLQGRTTVSVERKQRRKERREGKKEEGKRERGNGGERVEEKNLHLI